MYRIWKAEQKEYSTKMAADKLKMVMFLGSVREGRLGIRVAKFIQEQLKTKYDITLFGKYFLVVT